MIFLSLRIAKQWTKCFLPFAYPVSYTTFRTYFKRFVSRKLSHQLKKEKHICTPILMYIYGFFLLLVFKNHPVYLKKMKLININY